MTLGLTLGLSLMAGLSIPLGALIASKVSLRSVCLRHDLDSFVSYFGGGALLSAIALVLLPEGTQRLSIFGVSLAFSAGGLAFWLVDAALERTEGDASQFIGMMLDFVPEAILLGVAAANGSDVVFLLAGLILLQNMPEGFASYHEMHHERGGNRKLWSVFLTVPLLGPLAAWLGFSVLSHDDLTIGVVLTFCSGGILYLIFNDIAPRAHLKRRDFPAVGAVAGFLFGLVGSLWIH